MKTVQWIFYWFSRRVTGHCRYFPAFIHIYIYIYLCVCVCVCVNIHIHEYTRNTFTHLQTYGLPNDLPQRKRWLFSMWRWDKHFSWQSSITTSRNKSEGRNVYLKNRPIVLFMTLNIRCLYSTQHFWIWKYSIRSSDCRLSTHRHQTSYYFYYPQ
jgi:hypothetical protein